MRVIPLSSRLQSKLDALLEAAETEVLAAVRASAKGRRVCGVSCVSGLRLFGVARVELLLEEDLNRPTAPDEPFWEWWPTKIELSLPDGPEDLYEATFGRLREPDDPASSARWFSARVARRVAFALGAYEKGRPFMAWAGGWEEDDGVPRTTGYATPPADLAQLHELGLVPRSVRPESALPGDPPSSGPTDDAAAVQPNESTALDRLVAEELQAVRATLADAGPVEGAIAMCVLVDQVQPRVACVLIGLPGDVPPSPNGRLDSSYFFWDKWSVQVDLPPSGDAGTEEAVLAELEAADDIDPCLEVGWRVAEKLRAADLRGSASPHLVRYAAVGDPYYDDFERRVEEANEPEVYSRLVQLGAFDYDEPD